MRIAINQPYLYPYAGFFRLLAATDLFVVLDSVQWNRRGRVHRYEMNGKWVTLPIKKTDRDTTMIKDLQWQESKDRGLPPVDYICMTMSEVCDDLKIPFKTIRASALGIDPKYKGQDRIIAICKKLGATNYLNAPGGRTLYDKESFSANGIKLEFLPEYNGSYKSVFERLQTEDPEAIREEIYANM